MNNETLCKPTIDDILRPLDKAMSMVNQHINDSLKSEVALINLISQHIIHSGGKRLRPVALLLSAGAAEPDLFEQDVFNEIHQTGHNCIKLASVIEFIHTATLLHDDVVDESNMRRGKQTANDVFGNSASVLSGDFLYSRAFQVMTSTKNLEIIEILCNTTNRIAEGEVLQLLNIQNTEITEEEYFNTIEAKTAVLFEAACELGAIAISANKPSVSALKSYGYHLGMAFQLIDDILDYTGDSKKMGKNLGDDLIEGKVTLPLLLALQRANSEDKSLIIDAVKHNSIENIDDIIQIINKHNGIEDTQIKARHYINTAISSIADLPSSIYKQSLLDLAKLNLSRTN